MEGREVTAELVAVGSRQSAELAWARTLAAEAEARRMAVAVRAIAERVFLNLAADALEMPVGWRLSITHFALSASVSPLALAAARRRP